MSAWVLVPCVRCAGTGRVLALGFGYYNTLRADCPDCGGGGKVSEREQEGSAMTDRQDLGVYLQGDGVT